MGINDNHWMNCALLLAKKAQEQGEVPVGAVIVAQNKLVGSGYNQVIHNHDPTAHAEIVAIRAAATLIENYRLTNMTLYVTLEPCTMCAGALMQARINRLVFGARDFKKGAAGSRYNFLQTLQIDEGKLEPECSHLLKDFFLKRRY